METLTYKKTKEIGRKKETDNDPEDKLLYIILGSILLLILARLIYVYIFPIK